MAFAITTIRKPQSGAGGASAAAYLERELDIIQGANSDVMGNVLNEQYFDSQIERIKKALLSGTLSNAKTLDYQTKLEQTMKAKAAWSVTSNKLSGTGVEDLKSKLLDDWTSIWQNKDVLRSGNISAMASFMVGDEMDMSDPDAGGIMAYRSQLESFKNEISEIIIDDNILDSIQESIDFLDERREYWNSVVNYPSNFGLQMDTFKLPTPEGGMTSSVSNLKIVESGSPAGGYREVTKIKQGGNGVSVPLYLKPQEKNDAGEEVMKIGSNVWKGSEDFGYKLQGREVADFSSLNIVPPDYAPVGTIFKSSNGNFKVYIEPGKFIEYEDEKNLAAAGYEPERAVPITEKKDQRITLGYNVEKMKVPDRRAEMDKTLMQEFDNKLGQFTDKKYSDDYGLMVRGQADKDKGFSADQPFKLSTDDSYPRGKKKTTVAPNKEKGGFLSTVGKILTGRYKKSSSGRKDETNLPSDNYKILRGD